MDPLLRKKCCDSKTLDNEAYVTVFGIGVQAHKDYVILHGLDVEANKEYWIKVSKSDISDANSAILNSMD